MTIEAKVVFKSYDDELTAALQASLQAAPVVQLKKSCLRKQVAPLPNLSSTPAPVASSSSFLNNFFKSLFSSNTNKPIEIVAKKVSFKVKAVRFECNSIDAITQIQKEPQSTLETKPDRNQTATFRTRLQNRQSYSFKELLEYVDNNHVLTEHYLQKAFVQCAQKKYSKNNELCEKEELGERFVKALYEVVELMEKGEVKSPRELLKQRCLEKMAIMPPEDPEEVKKIIYYQSPKVNLKEAYEEVVSKVFEDQEAVTVLEKFFEQQVTPTVAIPAKKE